MVAELNAELEQMQNRLELSAQLQADQAATVDKLTEANRELQVTVDQNHDAYKMKVASIEEQLKDVEEAKRNFMDIMGPKFQELKADADSIVNDARKFKEQDMQMTELMKAAAAKFEEADQKYKEVNEKVEFTFRSADARFRELAEELKKADGDPDNNKKTGLLPDKMMVPKTFNSDILERNNWKEGVMKYFDESK